MRRYKHQFVNGQCSMCGQPQWGRLRTRLSGLASCPGVWWLCVSELEQYPFLATAHVLQQLHHKPVDLDHPVACYYSAQRGDYVFLYDAREVVLRRQATAKQQVSLVRAREMKRQAHTCTRCGRYVEVTVILPDERDQSRRCLCLQCGEDLSARHGGVYMGKELVFVDGSGVESD